MSMLENLREIIDRVVARNYSEEDVLAIVSAIQSHASSVYSGFKSANVGGNVTNSQIVTGDRNLVFNANIIIIDRADKEAIIQALETIPSLQTFKEAIIQAIETIPSLQTFPSPEPPETLIYDPNTWVGRAVIVDQLLDKLQNKTRILVITGISGIGKTTLGECIAYQAWEKAPLFRFIYLEILQGENDFNSHAINLLSKLGYNAPKEERNTPKILIKKLIEKLQANYYWIQLNSIEKLLNPNNLTEFEDCHWGEFFQKCLTEANFASRLVITTQAFPDNFVDFDNDYRNVWQQISLQGLFADERQNEHLDFFANRGITVDESNFDYLCRIGQIYEGHPLVLDIIAKEILAKPFDGDVINYWQFYRKEFEKVSREIQIDCVNPARYNQALQKKVSRRIEASLKWVPTDALDVLRYSSVYRRPVPDTFWQAMIENRSLDQQREACHILLDRGLAEKGEIYREQFLLRQHNLIRDIAYKQLKTNPDIWQAAERTAANLWLNAYTPPINTENLEQVRGYLEAFYHLCEIEDWDESAKILFTDLNQTGEKLGIKIGFWGYYRNQIEMYLKLCNKLSPEQNFTILKTIGNAYRLLFMHAEADGFYKQAFRLSCKLRNKEQRAWIFHEMGLMEADWGEDMKALKHYNRALKLFNDLDIRKGIALVNNDIARIKANQGSLTEAIDRYKYCLSIYPNLEDENGYAWILYNLGRALLDDGKYLDAKENIQRSLNLFDREENKTGIAWCLQGIAIATLSITSDTQLAKDSADKSLDLFRKQDNQSGVAWSLDVVGKIALKQRAFDMAFRYFEEELSIWEGLDHKIGIVLALKNLGNLHEKINQLEESKNCYSRARAIAAEFSIPLTD
jgi:tetratricopeptide (TPR) repeat protein